MKRWFPLSTLLIIGSRDIYMQHKFDVGKTRRKFHVKLKTNVELKKQRPSKVPLHLKQKLEKLPVQLMHVDIFREMGDDDKIGSLFLKPIILMPKSYYKKLVIYIRFLNSVMDLTNYSWPLKPVQMIMKRVKGNFFPSVIYPAHIIKYQWVLKPRSWLALSLLTESTHILEDFMDYVGYLFSSVNYWQPIWRSCLKIHCIQQ